MYTCCNLYVHQIFGTFMYVDTNSSVRSWQILFVNCVLQYVNGNADIQKCVLVITSVFQCFGVFWYFYELPEKEESFGPHVGIRFRDGEEDMKTPGSVADSSGHHQIKCWI